MGYRGQKSHLRGVYPTHDTSRMGTVRVKQEEEAEKNNSKRVVRNLEEWNAGMKRKTLKQGMTRAEDLTLICSSRVVTPPTED